MQTNTFGENVPGCRCSSLSYIFICLFTSGTRERAKGHQIQDPPGLWILYVIPCLLFLHADSHSIWMEKKNKIYFGYRLFFKHRGTQQLKFGILFKNSIMNNSITYFKKHTCMFLAIEVYCRISFSMLWFSMLLVGSTSTSVLQE